MAQRAGRAAQPRSGQAKRHYPPGHRRGHRRSHPFDARSRAGHHGAGRGEPTTNAEAVRCAGCGPAAPCPVDRRRRPADRSDRGGARRPDGISLTRRARNQIFFAASAPRVAHTVGSARGAVQKTCRAAVGALESHQAVGIRRIRRRRSADGLPGLPVHRRHRPPTHPKVIASTEIRRPETGGLGTVARAP